MDNVPQETHAVSVMTKLPLTTVAVVRDEKDDCLLPHQLRRPRLSKGQTQAERKPLQTQGAKFRAVATIFKTGHVDFGILPCVQTTRLRPDAYMKEHVSSDMLRLTRSPAKSQRKVVRKDHLHY